MKLLWTFAVVLVLAVLFLTVLKRSPRDIPAPPPADSIRLAYPLRQGGWLSVQRAAADLPKTSEERVRRIVSELSAVDSNPAVFSPLPETFPLRSVYLDGPRLYLDLAHEAVAELSGGTEEERIVLQSLTQSFSWNLPQIEQFQILVDGLPRRTLGIAGEDGGHLNVLDPIRLK